MRLSFPYQEVTPLEIPDRNMMGVYATPKVADGRPVTELVQRALREPIGTPPLAELAHDCRSVLIVCDDISRPTPVQRILPPILDELHRAGLQDHQVEFMLALGSHRFMTRAEMESKLGAEIVARHAVHNHDWKDPYACEYLGRTTQGVEVWINKMVARTDLVIGVGRIMPIDVCGFTGGGKILVPGVCGKITNDDMHWTRIDLPDRDILGKRDNPVRASIDALAQQAGLDFIVNVGMDLQQNIGFVVAGDLVEAHRRGCERAYGLHAVRIPRPADIVVADSYPFDIEFWQANKALDQAGAVVRKGGALILVSPCHEGFSATHRELSDLGYPDLPTIKEWVRRGRIKSKVVGVHMAQVSRVAREKATVFLVTPGISETQARKAGLEYAPTPQAALDEAFRRLGPDARVAALRGAAEMLPIMEESEDKS